MQESRRSDPEGDTDERADHCSDAGAEQHGARAPEPWRQELGARSFSPGEHAFHPGIRRLAHGEPRRGSTQEHDQRDHNCRSTPAAMREVHRIPRPVSTAPPARQPRPSALPRSQPIGSAPMRTPSSKPMSGSVARVRAVARGPANCTSSSPRTSSAARLASARRCTAAASPEPDADPTSQHAARDRSTGWACASTRSASGMSPSRRRAASVLGHTGGDPAEMSNAADGGCPARSSAASATTAFVTRSRSSARCRRPRLPNARRANVDSRGGASSSG